MATLEDAPFTVRHPKGLVRPDSYQEHTVGHVRNPRQDGSAVETIVAVQAAKGLKAIKDGMREVSCGYECRTDETPGVTPDGEHYDAVQRDIRYNHVSLVPQGRAGKTVRLRMDSSGDSQLEIGSELMIRIDGVDYPLETEADQKAASAAFARYAAKRDAECASEKARADEAQGKIVAFEAREKTRKDVAVKEAATRVLGKEGTPRDVIAKVLPTVKLDDRTDVEIEVLFDAAVAHFDSTARSGADSNSSARQAAQSQSQQRTDSKKRTVAEIRRDALREMHERASGPLSSSKKQ
jgi:hypothetical protein